jgi:hypothetical protein
VGWEEGKGGGRGGRNGYFLWGWEGLVLRADLAEGALRIDSAVIGLEFGVVGRLFLEWTDAWVVYEVVES